MSTLDASASLLTLLRAARDFTRRAADASDVEHAALDHAEARGWTGPEVGALRAGAMERAEARIAELEARAGALEGAATEAVNALEANGPKTALAALRKVLR